MTTAMQLDDACAGCAELRTKVEADRKRYGAVGVGLHCSECGGTVWAGRKPKAPAPLRVPTEGELAQRAARDLQRALADMACVSRYRAHAAGKSFSATLAHRIAENAGTDREDAKAAHVALPLTDEDRERDLDRGRRLNDVLCAIVPAAVAARARDRPALELLRVLASLAAWVNSDRPMPAPLPAAWARADDVRAAVATLEWLVARGGATETEKRPRPLVELVGVASVDAEQLRRWVRAGSKKDRRAKRATPPDELDALREVRLKGEWADEARRVGAARLAAAVAVWTAARRRTGTAPTGAPAEST